MLVVVPVAGCGTRGVRRAVLPGDIAIPRILGIAHGAGYEVVDLVRGDHALEPGQGRHRIGRGVAADGHHRVAAGAQLHRRRIRGADHRRGPPVAGRAPFKQPGEARAVAGAAPVSVGGYGSEAGNRGGSGGPG